MFNDYGLKFWSRTSHLLDDINVRFHTDIHWSGTWPSQSSLNASGHMPTTEKESSKMFVTHQFFIHRLYRNMAAAPASSGSDWNHWTICISWNIPSYSPQPFNGTKCYTSNMLKQVADSQCMRQGCGGHATIIISYHYTAGHSVIFFFFVYETLHWHATGLSRFTIRATCNPNLAEFKGFMPRLYLLRTPDVRRHGSLFYIQCSCPKFYGKLADQTHKGPRSMDENRPENRTFQASCSL